MICHECMGDIQVYDGIIVDHRDTRGRWCPMSGQAPFVWDEIAVRETVAGRSCGICEACCQRRATDMHHRISVGTGGKWTPANVIHVDRACHTWITDNPRKSYQLGLSLPSTVDPEKIPVKRLTGQVLFLSDQLLPPRGRKNIKRGRGRR